MNAIYPKKKVLIISPGFLPVPAVAGGAVECLIDSVIQYNERKNICELHVVSVYDNRVAKYDYKRTVFHYIKFSSLMRVLIRNGKLPLRVLSFIYARRIKRKSFIQEEFDAVIIENEPELLHLLKVFPNSRRYFHVHNDYSDRCMKYKKYLKLLSGILATSHYIKAQFSNLVAPELISVVYNGISLSEFEKQIPVAYLKNVKDKYGICENDYVFVYCGRLVKEKGVSELVKAFKKLYKVNNNCTLLIVGGSAFEESGETDYTKTLKLEAQECKKIVFTGYKKHESLPEIYQIADAGCIPSIGEEGFGLTLIEQLASGLPVLISDVAVFGEIVSPDVSVIAKRGDNFIDELYKGMIKLVSSDMLQKKKIKSVSQKIANKFSKEKYVENYFDFIGLKKC